jgi:hypothetical protein
MSDDERRLYVHLVDVFGIDHLTPEQEFVDSLGAIRMSRDQYDISIEILNRFGLVLRYRNNIMKLLDTVEPKRIR